MPRMDKLTAKRVIVDRLPEGALTGGEFRVETAPVGEPGPGQVLVRVMTLTIGAGQRAGLQGSASYAGAPETGVVMGGTGVAEVLQSRADGIQPGDLVVGQTGWQDQAVMYARDLRVVPGDTDPAHHLGVFGTNGMTAYFGLFTVGRPEPGQTVLVSAAAGSVGHLVGQLARLAGCRVVGVAGSDEKCAFLVDELGFDVAINRRGDDFRDRFRAATPDRVDVYFDNTGGDVLGSALFRMATGGRIVCCGAVSAYDTSTPGPGPRGVPGLLVNNRVRMEGFLVFDFAHRFDAARRQLGRLVADGRLRPHTTEYRGLESAPQAFVDLLGGTTTGTTIVRLD